jgi:SAM-dependent methyltransferase
VVGKISVIQSLKELLAEPATRGLALDDPATTTTRRKILRKKQFLNGIYREWYQMLAAQLPPIAGGVVELGSGAGFLQDFVPDAITSEVFFCEHVDIVMDARRMPFPDRSLRGIVMTDVLHHIPGPDRFFEEAERCLAPGGVIAMIEPWVTSWSKLIYQNLHHEPFQPEAPEWDFPQSGPLSGANGALPWIIFERDRDEFERQFPHFSVQRIHPIMPFRYLVSGGMSVRCLMPPATFGLWRSFETLISGLHPRTAMFAMIVVAKHKSAPARVPMRLARATGA